VPNRTTVTVRRKTRGASRWSRFGAATPEKTKNVGQTILQGLLGIVAPLHQVRHLLHHLRIKEPATGARRATNGLTRNRAWQAIPGQSSSLPSQAS